jgi:group I intron endonuclease
MKHPAIIYAIRGPVRVYLGQSFRSAARRKIEHFNALSRGTHFNRHLQSSWLKHGAEAFTFEVVEVLWPRIPQETLNEIEDRWVEHFRKRGGVYNSRKAAGSTFGMKHGAETKAKVSAAQKRAWADPVHREKMSQLFTELRSDPSYRVWASKMSKQISPEARARGALANTGLKRSDEARNKMRIAQTGKKQSMETRAKRSASLTGRPVSADTRDKIRRSNTGKTHSPEVREKMSIAKKLLWQARRANGAN